jgi:hypothetical protein
MKKNRTTTTDATEQARMIAAMAMMSWWRERCSWMMYCGGASVCELEMD